VDRSGCVVIVSGCSVEVLNPRLLHRRHIALPPSMSDVSETGVLDKSTGNLYFHRRQTRLYRAEIGRQLI